MVRYKDVGILNAGFHTFDYARHFLSCCSRMLGIEHIASRGSIMLEYYGRNVGVKIMPTGVDPSRFQTGFAWENTKWRRGELLSQVRLPFIALWYFLASAFPVQSRVFSASL